MQELLERVIAWFADSPLVQAIMASVILSVLRTIYDDRESTWERIGLEGAICGFLTLIAGSAIRALGVSDEWVMVIGGFIAFVGVATFRKLLVEKVRKHVGGDDGANL
jgi:lambda family phage holin